MIAFLGLTANEFGQAGLAVLVAAIGYILHHKSNHIEVKVDGQMTMMVSRIVQLERKLDDHSVAIPAALPASEIRADLSASEEIGKIVNGKKKGNGA